MTSTSTFERRVHQINKFIRETTSLTVRTDWNAGRRSATISLYSPGFQAFLGKTEMALITCGAGSFILYPEGTDGAFKYIQPDLEEYIEDLRARDRTRQSKKK